MTYTKSKTILSMLLVIAMISTAFAVNASDSDNAVYAASKKQTVKFKVNGGKFTQKKNTKKTTVKKKVSVNQKLGKTPKIKKEGYAFLGWYTKKSGGKKFTKNTKIKKKTTLYAKWTKKFAYDKTYEHIIETEFATVAEFEKFVGPILLSEKNEDDRSKLRYAFKSMDNKITYYVVEDRKGVYLEGIELPVNRVVNTTKTYKYNIFMKKMGVSDYVADKDLLDDTPFILYMNKKFMYLILMTKKEKVKPTSMLTIVNAKYV